jgi:hypothetical protein
MITMIVLILYSCSGQENNEFWEWVSVKIDDVCLEFRVKLSMSDNSNVRFVGKYTEDRELSGIEKKNNRCFKWIQSFKNFKTI